jgi:phage terminase small subunit
MSKNKRSKATDNDRLSKQQEVFVNQLVKGDTQRQAFYKAYPHSKKWKETTVDSKASTLFAQGKVRERFHELNQIVKDNLVKDTIATQQEALEFFTRLMRRELKEQVVASQSRKVVNYDEEGRRTEVSTRDPVIVDIDAKLSDAFKGAEAIAKYYNIFGSHDNAEELSKLDKLLKAMKDNANVD